MTVPLPEENTDLGGFCSMVMVRVPPGPCELYTALKVACDPACTTEDREWILAASEEPPAPEVVELDLPEPPEAFPAPVVLVVAAVGVELLQAPSTTPAVARATRTV